MTQPPPLPEILPDQATIEYLAECIGGNASKHMPSYAAAHEILAEVRAGNVPGLCAAPSPHAELAAREANDLRFQLADLLSTSQAELRAANEHVARAKEELKLSHENNEMRGEACQTLLLANEQSEAVITELRQRLDMERAIHRKERDESRAELARMGDVK